MKHFEILDSSSIIGNSYFQIRHRRDTDLHQQNLLNSKGAIELQIRLFGESYTLLLHHDSGSIIDPDFLAVRILSNGSIILSVFFTVHILVNIVGELLTYEY